MIKRILVPVDFSETSCRAAHYAIGELAPQLGADVVLVTVLEASDLRIAMRAGLHGFDTDEEVHRQVHEWVEGQFAKLEGGSGDVKTQRDVRHGLPDQAIAAAIREHKPDLIVMGAAGMSRREPIGNQTENIIRHVDIPVLLIHDKSHEKGNDRTKNRA
jgi:nucleotide-binding universal stress UspA family protein